MAQAATFRNRFTSLLTDEVDLPGAAEDDRKLKITFPAHIPSVYDISNEKTTVLYFGNAEYLSPFSPIDKKIGKMEIGPN